MSDIALAGIGFAFVVIASWFGADFATRESVDKNTLEVDRLRFFDNQLRIEGFNREFLLNLLLGSMGICFVVLPHENEVLLGASVLVGCIDIVFASAVARALQDDFNRIEDEDKYKKVCWWRYVTLMWVAVSIVLALVRFGVANAVGTTANIAATQPSHVGWWPKLANSAEFVGVLFLSVEAIKLENLRRIANVLRIGSELANPEIEFIDSSRLHVSQHMLSGATSFLVGILVVFVGTPIWLSLMPLLWFLAKIEKHTKTGVIGILGFLLWSLSFFINKYVL